MEMQQLRYFLAVAERLNITRAAADLYISQQALSTHIHKLEGELGAQLFTRSPALSLTSAGKLLVKSAAQMLEIERGLTNGLSDISGNVSGELRVGISYTRGQAILPDILPAFLEKYPHVNIELFEENFTLLCEKLKHGDLDFLIGSTPVPVDNTVEVELARERLFLVVPHAVLDRCFGDGARDVAAALKRQVDIALLARCPFILLNHGNRIRSIMDDMFNHRKVSPKVILETENIQTAFALARQGVGLTAYPEMFITSRRVGAPRAEEYDFYPLDGVVRTDTLVIAYSKKTPLPGFAEDFVALTRTAFAEKAGPAVGE